MKLPELKDCIIVHYGCPSFEKPEHIVEWIAAISHEPSKKYFFENTSEVETIEKFKSFIDDNQNKTFIHWSMNSFKFGFKAIAERYHQLTNNVIDLHPKIEVDLSEHLKNKYGIDYIKRDGEGRLNNLAKLNAFSGYSKEVEVVTKNAAADRLELIFSIVQADLQGKLKTETKQLPKLSEALLMFNNPETIDKLHEVLKGYFKGNEAELRMALEGEKLGKRILFPSNQNKFVEVFSRLKYNGCLSNKPIEIKKWLCSNFAFQFDKGAIKEVRPFNSSTVNDILTKQQGLPTKSERIKIDWLDSMKR
jgi:hypothetical protein